jgi:DNA modification methylase
MKPYYADDAVTIYHGDCRDVLPERDAVVTDPPYGVNARQRDHAKNEGPVLDWDAEYPHDVINREVQKGGSVLAFGAATTIARELAAFTRTPRVLIWSPRFKLGMLAKDGMAFRYHPIYAWGVRAIGPTVRDVFDESTEAGNWWNHPATKPVRLMTALVSLTTGTVLDPFMGSGTTLVAAKGLGRKAIGVELDERYCEIAARRCSQEVLGLSA